MDGITQALKELTSDGEPWEPGDQDYIICNDGIVIVEMGENRDIHVNVIAGKPKYANINLNLTEEDDDDES